MKLLLDQNLSRKLVQQLNQIFPGTVHVSSVLSETSEDRDIWRFAEVSGFVIVTKDDDFEQLSFCAGTRLRSSGFDSVTAGQMM